MDRPDPGRRLSRRTVQSAPPQVAINLPALHQPQQDIVDPARPNRLAYFSRRLGCRVLIQRLSEKPVWLVDHSQYAEAERITIVCDNLNRHWIG
ncbi:MAG: hypothetical protein ACK5Q5_21380 [Planctomycetaceae bacterium]